MDPAKAMYPNHWQGQVPEGYAELVKLKRSVDINIVYNIEYIQHRFCERWTSTENLKVLFHGCGTGEGLMVSAIRYPYTTFLACDPSTEALDLARQYAAELGLENISFVDEGEISGQFDMVWSARPLHHYDEPGVFFASVKTLLALEGLFMFSVDADFENHYFLDFSQRLHDILNYTNDVPAFNQAMQSFKKDLAEYLANNEWPVAGVLNVPGIYRLMENQGLQILEFINHYNYEPDMYIPDEERKATLQCDDPRLRHALAELVSGRMLRHHMVLAFPDRKIAVPRLDDPDVKNCVPWRSPFIAMRTDGERVILSLNHDHLALDDRIVLEDVSVPANMLDIIRRFDTTSSMQVIHRRFLPMSWDLFYRFITACWECELVYLHRK